MQRSALAGCLAFAVLLFMPFTGASAFGPSPSSGRVVIGFTEKGYADAGLVEGAVGARVVARIPRLHADVVQLAGDPGDVLERLRAEPSVRYAEIDGTVHALRAPNDEFLPTQWSIDKTHAQQAWDLTTGSPQVVIAVIDTGVDTSQPDLGGKAVAGFDYVNNDQDPSDDNGHGTAVAGVVAANSNNQIGVAGYCWSCRVMPVKVLDADGAGFDSAVAQGMVWAADHGARVLNLSLGGPTNDAVLTAATQYATSHGALVVAAAGNEGATAPAYPAALPNVLSVGASDQNDRLYSFSNSAARVAAPGENSTVGRGNYVSFLGTSSAAPVVSGIAGLAFSLVPEATPAAVAQALETTAVPIPGVVAGRVDAYRALSALAPPAPAPPSANQTPPATPRESRSGAAPQTRQVVSGRVRRGRPSRFSLAVGPGEVAASCRLARRGLLRVRLIANGRVVARGRGSGRATARLELPARAKVVVLVDTANRRSTRFTLGLSYPPR